MPLTLDGRGWGIGDGLPMVAGLGVCEFGGLDPKWWNGIVEWSTGLDYWSV